MTCTKPICRIKKRQASIVEVTRVAGYPSSRYATKKQGRSSESRHAVKFGTSSLTATWRCTRSCASAETKKYGQDYVKNRTPKRITQIINFLHADWMKSFKILAN